MGRKRKGYIDREESRYGLFMSENSFNLDIDYGLHYINNDVIHEVYVHKINIIESKAHKLYGQAKTKDKKFMPPVKISVMIDIGDSEQSYYGNTQGGGIVRDDTGKLNIGVYLKELEEKNLEIDRGDIIEYNLSGERPRFYEVENAQNVVDTTKQTIGGFRPYWKLIIAVPVKEDVVPFLNGDSLA